MTAAATRDARQLGRLLAALARPGAQLAHDAAGEGRVEVQVPGSSSPILICPDRLVGEAASRGLLWRDGRAGQWRVTAAGAAFLRRSASTSEPFRRQHLEVGHVVSPQSATGRLEIVENESPLAWLRRRRGPDGRPLVSDAQFAAGEKLRADYTRSGLMPKLGVDLSQPPMPRGQGATANRVADAVDAAVAARERVTLAMGFMGSNLGSLLIDVCCELVGLEEVERRRRWPRRSGKVVLSIALDRLAEHYGLGEVAEGPDAQGRIRRWGTADFRPSAGD